MKLRRLILIPAIFASLAVVGCSSSSKALSAASFEAQGNALCAKYSAQIKDLGQPSQSDLPQLASWLNNLADLGQKETDDLKGLKPPATDTAKLDSALQAQQDQVGKVHQLASSLKAGSLASAQSQLQQLQSTDGSVNTQFDAVGLNTCGTGSSS